MYISCDEGEIVNVAVLPQARRMGVGDALMEESSRRASLKNVQQIVLEVRVSNEAAIRLYEKHGYVRCGIRRGFYELPKEDAYIMVCKPAIPTTNSPA
jgi:ribosomal-protein-alanine N-acetyltransferase